MTTIMNRRISDMNEREYRAYNASVINKRRRSILIKKLILIAVSVVCLFIVIGCFTSKASEERTVKVSKFYTYTNLSYDQSISDLAAEYFNSADYCNSQYYSDVEEYLAEIKEINHISNDSAIAGGKLLYIPYYVEYIN